MTSSKERLQLRLVLDRHQTYQCFYTSTFMSPSFITIRNYSKLILVQGAAGTAAEFLVGARARTLTRPALERVTFEMDMTLKILGWVGTGVDSKIKNVIFLTMVTMEV